MTETADPEKYFAITLDLVAVRNDDFDAVQKALIRVRDEFCRGGSGISVERVRPGAVINR